MGRGDKRGKRSKICRGSSGKTRPKKATLTKRKKAKRAAEKKAG